MIQSNARITGYPITALCRAAARRVSKYHNRRKRAILLFDALLSGTRSDNERSWGELVPINDEGMEEREVIIETFFLKYSEAQPAQKTGICQQLVSQLKKQALCQMKAECKKQGITV
ncbi:MAG: hypothetical protein AAGU27_23665 [Dehalobacterium sp.]